MRAIELRGFSIDQLLATERPQPAPEAGEALVRVTACSLNYRDYLMAQGQYNPKQKLPLIPLSDGVGEVVAVGYGVTKLKPGDRVLGLFFPHWLAGEPTVEKLSFTTGGPNDGWLCDYRTYPAAALVKVPDCLSDEEAATLPCAGLTAWSAIVTLGGVKPGDLVLVQGTGGVALFALQFAKLCGAEVIVTSASDEKLKKAKALGADQIINYRTNLEWGKAARALSNGRGVNHVVELGGAGTLMQSIRAVRPGGTVSMIGVLSGPSNELHIPLVVMQQIRLQGVSVGSKEGLEAMLRAIALARLKPVLDKSFDCTEAGVRAAYTHIGKGGHFGKITVRLS